MTDKQKKEANLAFARFAEWWYKIGSGIVKLPTEDNEEHARRVAAAAWEFAIREAVNEWEKPYGLTDGRRFIDRLRDMANVEQIVGVAKR